MPFAGRCFPAAAPAGRRILGTRLTQRRGAEPPKSPQPPPPQLPVPNPPVPSPPQPSPRTSPSIPVAQARTDSSVSTRPSCAPSPPTTQLPLQQEPALVNQCSSPVNLCFPGREEGRERDPGQQIPLCRPAAGSSLGRGAAGLERFGEPWSRWDARRDVMVTPEGLVLCWHPLPRLQGQGFGP